MPKSFTHRRTHLRIVRLRPERIDGSEPHAIVKLPAMTDDVGQYAPDLRIVRSSLDDARLWRAHLQFHFSCRRTILRLKANAVSIDCLKLLLGYWRCSGDCDHR